MAGTRPRPEPSEQTELTTTTVRALSRAISRCERGPEEAAAALAAVGPPRGALWVIGVTGPPGSGKSTLVDRLVGQARERALRVAVLAVDPSSVQTGGAILGDRVRMLRHTHDRSVYIRSMAARSAMGGLSLATRDALRVLDAYGFDVAFLETVGVGQSEIDVVKVADTVMLVTVPGMGDDVQMLKAGTLEIADVFVVNKADLPDADRAVAELLAMLRLGTPRADETVVVKTVATADGGVSELWSTLERARVTAAGSGVLAERRSQRLVTEVRELVERRALAVLRRRADQSPAVRDVLTAVRDGALDPHEAASRIIAALLDSD
ncbi:MAG: methylmalonyl Co-A mutase-associated GTPase MeaB [Chloroflexota bacterium]